MKKLIFTILIGVIISLSGVNYTQATAHTAGTNFKTPDGTIWYVYTPIYGNPPSFAPQYFKRPYTSAGSFMSYSFNDFGKVENATAEDIALSEGEFMPPRNGSVMCSDRGADRGTCYLITNYKKAGFTSASVFSCLGFSFHQHVYYGDLSWLPTDEVINTCSEAHRPGVVVNNNGTIQLLGSGTSIGFPTWDIFLSWGFFPEDVVPANKLDTQSQQLFIVGPRPFGPLSPWDQFVM